MDKIWIGKTCTIVARSLDDPEKKLYYTAFILNVDPDKDGKITFKDKFNEIISFEHKRIIQINEKPSAAARGEEKA